MIRYRLFALDNIGRIDRGFERLCHDDAEAIRYAGTIPDAAQVEVMREQRLIARIRHHNGEMTVTPAL